MIRPGAGTAICVLAAGLCACGDYTKNEAAYNSDNAAYSQGEAGNYAAPGNASANYSAGATASSGWPGGSRIVVENGVTYRIGPDDVRVALGPADSRIVVENGTRFRVDPSGTRVRIDASGAEISASPGDTTVNVMTNTP